MPDELEKKIFKMLHDMQIDANEIPSDVWSDLFGQFEKDIDKDKLGLDILEKLLYIKDE